MVSLSSDPPTPVACARIAEHPGAGCGVEREGRLGECRSSEPNEDGRRQQSEIRRGGWGHFNISTESIEDTEKSNKALCTLCALWLKNQINYIFQQPCPPPAAPTNTRTPSVAMSGWGGRV
ncbi:MAG: hypothetical protein HF976_13710 [ANME-2 cluster archaeon]|nr:hypothetical protein [ANME-2 cluster archaeon]MBC2708356.1 hypothetical protein [ANME-2 cluster archaeon]MBC2746693.1 hypothetical protein [ANME-2 cluster archaeon]